MLTLISLDLHARTGTARSSSRIDLHIGGYPNAEGGGGRCRHVARNRKPSAFRHASKIPPTLQWFSELCAFTVTVLSLLGEVYASAQAMVSLSWGYAPPRGRISTNWFYLDQPIGHTSTHRSNLHQLVLSRPTNRYNLHQPTGNTSTNRSKIHQSVVAPPIGSI